MATATKVIAHLRDEGLVSTQPGVGTLVRQPRLVPVPREREPGSAPPALTRELIVRTALALADSDGLEGAAPRRVAVALGVPTKELHRHVRGREDLLTAMLDAVFDEEPWPLGPPAHWRDRLELSAHRTWRMFQRHPWAAPLLSMTRPHLSRSAIAFSEFSLGPLARLGLDADEVMSINLTLTGYVRGTAMSLQPERRAEQDTDLTADEWMDTQTGRLAELVASGHYPGLRYVSAHGFDYDLDALFEYGLQRLLDGAEARIRELGLLPEG
ncbi:MAG: TetR/AcrR family transcriptional regulator C-terminal domain-containing protein [Nocardiopsis sp. BM-2018]|nr:MAG: TetR/AcrR family transcriptional regulator C-terminal domain-containing protein [Nocardiopsis sp. BM-2018]